MKKDKITSLLKSNIKFLLLALLVAVADLWSKKAIFALIDKKSLYGVINIFPGFNLVQVWNRGVSFGMFHDLKYAVVLLSIITVTIAIVVLIWLFLAEKTITKVGIALVLGGALGNIIDRLLNGAVADFLDFYIKSYHWPAFNLADSAVTVGVTIIIISDFISFKQTKKTKS